jgi:acylphosphatase
MEAPKRAFTVHIEGRVQRLGYRRIILEAAQELEIQGYVRNEPDGSIMAHAQGREDRLKEFLAKIKAPPPPITVRRFEETPATLDPSIKHFQIIYGPLGEELQEGFGAMQSEFGDYRQEFRGFLGEFRDYRQEFRDYRQEFRDYRQEFRASLGRRLSAGVSKLRRENRPELQGTRPKVRRDLPQAQPAPRELPEGSLGDAYGPQEIRRQTLGPRRPVHNKTAAEDQAKREAARKRLRSGHQPQRRPVTIYHYQNGNRSSSSDL